MNDDLTGIFDHLSPDDFLLPDGSAQSIDMRPDSTFDQFIADQITLLKFGFAASDGQVNPMTVLATGNTAMVFQADDDETLGNYIDRMAREAHRLNARWAFFYKRTMITKPAERNVDADDDDLMSAALNSGEAIEAVYWYASRRDGDSPPMRHGYVEIVGNKLGVVAEAPTQTNGLLDKILD